MLIIHKFKEVKILKKVVKIFIIFLLAASTLNFAFGQNETEITLANSELESKNKINDEVKAREEGHFNISFDDGYNGYCINYGKNHALIGDSFTVTDTSHATNNKTGESIGNYLKVFFVDYYEEAMKNEIVTQHTIWHFSDDFNGWRLDYDLIENIKTTALKKSIPDHGATLKINDTTEAVFDFEVLKSGNSNNQHFFGYKISYRDIMNEIENSSETNPTNKSPAEFNKSEKNPERNDSSNNKSNISHTEKVKQSNYIKTSSNHDMAKKINDDNLNNRKVNLSNHKTGNTESTILILMAVLLCIVLIRHIRD